MAIFAIIIIIFSFFAASLRDVARVDRAERGIEEYIYRDRMGIKEEQDWWDARERARDGRDARNREE